MNDETRAFSIGRERPFVFWEEHTVSSAMPFIIWRCMTELVTQMKRRFHFMHNYIREDILRLVEEEDVAFIRLQFTDIFGAMKNMAVTVSQLEKALDNRCMFDVSSLEGLSGEEDSDMYLYPDLSTFEIFPWRPQQGKVARLICDVYRTDGTPYEVDPRYVLKRYTYIYCLMRDRSVSSSCSILMMMACRQLLHMKGADISTWDRSDFGENARRDMVLTLEDMGF